MKKDIKTVIAIAFIFTLIFGSYGLIILWAGITESLAIIIFGIFPLIASFLVCKVAKERINEIRKENKDDFSKY